VVAGLYHGKQVGEPNVITIDIGGTSFDVSLIAGGRFSTTTESWIDDATPLSLAMLDVRSIGAGGGSIAWIDSGGALKVGPLSAGAEPGPACYGRGGTEPTVTDANVVLGRLGAMTLLGGRLAIQEELAREAVSAKVALPLALGVEEAAAGIIRICVANMAAQLKAITAERGVNPRDFVIVAGGGGGPLHAALLAREFEIARVLVPPFPGLLSAGGLILSDLRVDRLRSFRCRIERDGVEGLRVAVERLLEEVEAALRAEGYEGDPVVEVALDMKYTGQNWEISVSIDPAAISVEDVCRRFDQHHDKLYGFSSSAHTHEVLSVRASAIGPNLRAMDFIPRRSLPARADAAAAPGRTRRMWDDDQGTFVEGPLVDRDRLAAGSSVAGPAFIEGMDSTVWVPSGGVASVDEFGNILLDLRRQAA
jgi:N-methylhydantoinase A